MAFFKKVKQKDTGKWYLRAVTGKIINYINNRYAREAMRQKLPASDEPSAEQPEMTEKQHKKK